MRHIVAEEQPEVLHTVAEEQPEVLHTVAEELRIRRTVLEALQVLYIVAEELLVLRTGSAEQPEVLHIVVLEKMRLLRIVFAMLCIVAEGKWVHRIDFAEQPEVLHIVAANQKLAFHIPDSAMQLAVSAEVRRMVQQASNRMPDKAPPLEFRLPAAVVDERSSTCYSRFDTAGDTSGVPPVSRLRVGKG